MNKDKIFLNVIYGFLFLLLAAISINSSILCFLFFMSPFLIFVGMLAINLNECC